MASKFNKPAFSKIAEYRAGVICVCDDRLLFIKGYDATIKNRRVLAQWGFPKGSVNGNESLQETAIRELYEETNISIEPTELISSITIIRELCHETVTFYVAKFSKQPEIKIQEDEISDFGWYTLSEASELKCTTPTEEAIKQLQFLPLFRKKVILPSLDCIFANPADCKFGQS